MTGMIQQRVDMSSVAEEIYHQLSDDVTCRASALKSLVVTSCSSDVIQLLTALCSQLLHLQIIDCSQVNQSINQSVDQSINRSINQSINQSISQSINQSINQSISRSINQSIS